LHTCCHKKSIPALNVYAIDISKNALAVAAKNAANNNAAINFKQLNFLDEAQWHTLSNFDTIISNPPYIAEHEISSMQKNVTAYEPHLALFVADNNALIFYEVIAKFATTHLNKNGKIFVEINEHLAKETIAVFEKYAFNCLLRKDLQGKYRMIKAEKL